MKYPYRLSDEADIQKIMESLERERRRISGEESMLVRGLHRTNITCTGFMQSNPNVQLAYAQHNGFFPSTGEEPDHEE